MIKELTSHVENRIGQNENLFALIYLAWRAADGFNECVKLCFKVAGHTKGFVEDLFGHLNRRLKTTDNITPRDMMGVVCESSSANLYAPSADIIWRVWNPFLKRYFKIPAGFTISKYHIFNFSVSRPRTFTVMEFSFSTVEKGFSFLLRGMTIDAIRKKTTQILMSELFKSVVTQLSEVESIQQEARRYYLVDNIIEKDYAGNLDIFSEFVNDGTEREKW